MSYQASEWALDHPGVRGTHKLVLIAIANRSDKAGKCWPSIASLADRIGMSRRAVARVVSDLATAGIIAMVSKVGIAASITLLGFAESLYPAVSISPRKWPIPRSDCAAIPRTEFATAREVLTGDPRTDVQGGREVASHEPVIEPIKEPVIEPVNSSTVVLTLFPSTPKPTPKSTRAPSLGLPQPIPDWMPAAEWEAFVASRIEMKKAMGELAMAGMIRKLAGFRSRGIDVRETLNEAVINCWQSVVDPTERRRGNSSVPRQTTSQAARASHFAPPTWNDEVPTIDGSLARDYS